MSISISYFPILSNHFLSIENSPPAITGVLNKISLNSVKNDRETTIISIYTLSDLGNSSNLIG